MASFQELIEWMNCCPEDRLCLEKVTARLRDTEIQLDHVEDCVCFKEERYQRNLHALGSHYYALVLCWLPGQSSPIHDHQGASCAIKVIQGDLTEQRYEPRADGSLKVVQETIVKQGSVCGSQDGDIHRVTNHGSEPLVTLHIYSPYLSNFNIYDEVTGEKQVFADPVVEANAQRQKELRSAGNPL